MTDTAHITKLLGLSNDALVNLLLQLKEKDKLFHQEQKALKMDFLVRGICDKEVDGLLEDESLFPSTWLPKHLRWESISNANEQLPELITNACMFFDCKKDIMIDLEDARKIIRFLNKGSVITEC